MRTTRSRHLAGALLAAMVLSAAAPAGASWEAPKSTGDYVWRAVRGDEFLKDAFSATPDGTTPVHICRVHNYRDVLIGYLDNWLCQVGGDGMSRPYSIFLTLITAPAGAHWQKPEGDEVPAGALELNEGYGPPTYACRVTYEGKTVVGMVRENICSAGYVDGELRSDDYEVLVGGGSK
ncbi:DUF3421 domain-containing protein [Rhodobium gokarnense]|uniref:Uncharacterized protein n=1 Tax=Rhodobium gokarnense TaxID=364296 RepID=A0ABT3H7V3_9HYPH|nr:DUF3421 domain-containing protein [Rhodobium gokarnense]MCW2306477.1 hypothetical protein [Rhodobium gokarnense]